MELPKAVVDMYGGSPEFRCSDCHVVAEWTGGFAEDARLVCRNESCLFADETAYDLHGILHVMLAADLDSLREYYRGVRQFLREKGALYKYAPPYDYELVPA